MVKLPDASALGARDPRAVQGVPSFAPSPVPGALVGLGLATQRLAGQIAQERQDSRDFGLKSRFLQFEQEWDTHLADRSEAAEEGAVGFTEGILKDYETGARKLMQSVPDE